MARGRNIEFFVKKREWSVVKDALLQCYLAPYFTKILRTGRPLVYVDCFAGKGRFDDGNVGSPIIALDIFQHWLKKTTVQSQKKSIEAYFVELDYHDELKKNLEPYFKCDPSLNIFVNPGSYEEQIRQILQDKKGMNLFLYLDPYGVKHLDLEFLGSLSSNSGNSKFCSTEFLLNFNSHGFLRVACQFLKINFPSISEVNWDYLTEYDNFFDISQSKTEQMLNRVAGGDYWKEMIRRYYAEGNKSFYDLEEDFTQEYCKRLRNYYSYVLNMPIRVKESHSPKYRMIYATNHPDGVTLMADNIYKRKGEMHEMQLRGQQILFGLDYDNRDTVSAVRKYLSTISVYQRLNSVMANFFNIYGVFCNPSEFSGIFKNLEEEGKLEVIRNPAKTKSGKPRKFCTESENKTIELKWKS